MSETFLFLTTDISHHRIQLMATTTSEPPPTTRRDPSPVSSTTRESFALQTQTPGQAAPHPEDLQLRSAVQFLPARCQGPGQAATTLARPPGCPTLPTPNSTPSLGRHRGRKLLQILLSLHPEITPEETVACWTAQPNCHTTATDIPPSIPATAWASLLP